MALFATEPDRIFGDHTLWLQATDSNGKPGPAIGASFSLAMRDAVISSLSVDPQVTNGSTGSTQTTSVQTTVAAGSDGQAVPQPTLNVASTAGFPATCTAATQCQITVGTTITASPGTVVSQAFTYTGTTGTTFTGLAPVAPVPPATYQFSTGATVLFDAVPAGFEAVNATATASLPGWVIYGAKACVVPGAATAPKPINHVETACADPANVTDLSTNAIGALVGVNGFVPLPAPLLDPEKFWIVVQAQEGPDGADCTVQGACRWSPWLYYDPTTNDAYPATYRTITYVTTGPTTSGVAASPSPNNGFGAAAGNLGLVDSFDVQATATSSEANIALAEAFLAPSRPVGTSIADPLPCTTPPDTPAGCVVFGQGAEMTSADGLWGNSMTKQVTAFLPLSELQGMPDGLVRVWVHAKDVAGNWGPFASADLVLDRSQPVVDGAVNTAPTATTQATQSVQLPAATLRVQSVSGFPASGKIEVRSTTGVQVLSYTGTATGPPGARFTGVSAGTGRILSGATVTAFTGAVTVTAHDPLVNGVATGVAAAEWFTGTDPGPSNGTAVIAAVLPGPANQNQVSFTIGGLPAGTVGVRVKDAAGNWSATTTVTS